METNLVMEGLKFMALGMGTVFLFLIIMIAFMMLQARIIRRCFPEPNQEGGAACSVSTPVSTPTVQDKKTNKVAAIVAAIFEDKKKS
jgi:oxaloacetate decarboxylase gamma subunit